MGRYNPTPSKGHICDMLIIFVYLKHHMDRRIICNTRLLDDQVYFDIELNWSNLYPDTVEDIPPNVPDPKGKSVRITTFVYADHSNDI